MKFLPKSKGNFAPGYLILNLLRVCNIICLLSCLAASAVMLVKTFIVSKFFFFDATSHIITGIMAIFLTITETPLFRKYFVNNWPLLSISSGLVTLGVLMVVLGTLILGNLNKEATSEDSLGTSFWQLLIASGIITCIFGVLNIVSNYLFRKRKLGVNARMVRAYGASAAERMTDVYATGPGNRGADAYNEWREKAVVAAPSAQPSYDSMREQLQQQQQQQQQQSDHRAPSPSYYGSEPSLKRAPSVIEAPLGGPYARSATPLSRASTQNTRWPCGAPRRSITAPIIQDHDQFKRFHNARDIPRPEDAAHPAFRGDGGNWV